MSKGDTIQFEEYGITYQGTRMEVDKEKRMLFADVDVTRDGKPVGSLHPAKFFYKSGGSSMGGDARTVVAKYITLRDDLYMIIGMVNPQTKVAAFQMHVNTLISFIWIGCLILMIGSVVAMWPDVALEEAGAWSYVRAGASATTAVIFGVLLAAGSGQAYGAPAPSTAVAAPVEAPVVAPAVLPAP